MSVQVLNVLMNGESVGQVHRRAERGRELLSFSYASNWLRSGPGVPLSASMPLSNEEYGHTLISNFLWGLLPENEMTLHAWARRHKVGLGSGFGLLSNMGEDCAGAVQFVPPDRQDALRAGALEPISEQAIGAELRRILDDPGGPGGLELGRFSLAGAQSKIALRAVDGGWAVPSGAEPTSHIIKPARADIPGHAENEHFCLMLAAELGFRAAHSKVHYFDGQSAIVVERYDRRVQDDALLRIHQEDMCQALGVHPTNKYENDGGPGLADMTGILGRVTTRHARDKEALFRAALLNLIIGGTDAHAKNYSIVYGRDQQAVLAPLYDVASFLPYMKPGDRLPPFAMYFSGHGKDQTIMPRHIEAQANASGIPPEHGLAMLQDLLECTPEACATTASACAKSGVCNPVIPQLAELITGRVGWLKKRFGNGP
ncbi:MAG: type II toxin-antitoxin system HipA family toxin [Aquisalimonadaceae bacterium]